MHFLVCGWPNSTKRSGPGDTDENAVVFFLKRLRSLSAKFKEQGRVNSLASSLSFSGVSTPVAKTKISGLSVKKAAADGTTVLNTVIESGRWFSEAQRLPLYFSYLVDWNHRALRQKDVRQP